MWQPDNYRKKAHVPANRIDFFVRPPLMYVTPKRESRRRNAEVEEELQPEGSAVVRFCVGEQRKNLA